MSFTHTVLKNGLTVIGEYQPSAVSTAFGFFVRTGARDETLEVSGVSHFLEHMLFKGTAKRSALELTYAMGAIGAQANAFTSEENTVYYMGVLPEYLGEGFEILADMMRPALDEEEFSTEKNVILEEIALYQDRPTHVLFEAAMQRYFAGHTAGHSVLGTTESITALTRAQMKQYFDLRYAPSNVVLSISGQFQWNEFLEMAEKYCGHWSDYAALRELKPHTPKVDRFEFTRANLNCGHLCLVSAGPSSTDEERYASAVHAFILGGGSGSKMHWALVDKGLCDSVGVSTEEMDGTGIIYTYASFEPTNRQKVEEIIDLILQAPMDFSDEDFSRAKTKLATRLVLEGESTMRRCMAIGSDWIYRKSYSPLEEELHRLQSITREDIAAAQARFPVIPQTRVVLLPED